MKRINNKANQNPKNTIRYTPASSPIQAPPTTTSQSQEMHHLQPIPVVILEVPVYVPIQDDTVLRQTTAELHGTQCHNLVLINENEALKEQIRQQQQYISLQQNQSQSQSQAQAQKPPIFIPVDKDATAKLTSMLKNPKQDTEAKPITDTKPSDNTNTELTNLAKLILGLSVSSDNIERPTLTPQQKAESNKARKTRKKLAQQNNPKAPPVASVASVSVSTKSDDKASETTQKNANTGKTDPNTRDIPKSSYPVADIQTQFDKLKENKDTEKTSNVTENITNEHSKADKSKAKNARKKQNKLGKKGKPQEIEDIDIILAEMQASTEKNEIKKLKNILNDENAMFNSEIVYQFKKAIKHLPPEKAYKIQNIDGDTISHIALCEEYNQYDDLESIYKPLCPQERFDLLKVQNNQHETSAEYIVKYTNDMEFTRLMFNGFSDEQVQTLTRANPEQTRQLQKIFAWLDTDTNSEHSSDNVSESSEMKFENNKGEYDEKQQEFDKLWNAIRENFRRNS